MFKNLLYTFDYLDNINSYLIYYIQINLNEYLLHKKSIINEIFIKKKLEKVLIQHILYF